MSLIGNSFGPTAGPAGPLFNSSQPGNWSYTVKAGDGPTITIEGWAAGGKGQQANGSFGPGGGGGGYFKYHNLPVAAGNIISGNIGAPSVPGFTVSGGSTTANGPGLACVATGGQNASGVPGVGGTATGGTTNTSGNAGGRTDIWDGGSAGNGGGDQTIQTQGNGALANSGTNPGGGSCGGGSPTGGLFPWAQSAANGQILITKP